MRFAMVLRNGLSVRCQLFGKEIKKGKQSPLNSSADGAYIFRNL